MCTVCMPLGNKALWGEHGIRTGQAFNHSSKCAAQNTETVLPPHPDPFGAPLPPSGMRALWPRAHNAPFCSFFRTSLKDLPVTTIGQTFIHLSVLGFRPTVSSLRAPACISSHGHSMYVHIMQDDSIHGDYMHSHSIHGCYMHNYSMYGYSMYDYSMYGYSIDGYSMYDYSMYGYSIHSFTMHEAKVLCSLGGFCNS